MCLLLPRVCFIQDVSKFSAQWFLLYGVLRMSVPSGVSPTREVNRRNYRKNEKSTDGITKQNRNVAKQTPTRTPKSIKNHSKSVLGAMLAQDDTSLEPSWPEMSPRIDFSLFFSSIWGNPKCTKNRFKNQAIFRHP